MKILALAVALATMLPASALAQKPASAVKKTLPTSLPPMYSQGLMALRGHMSYVNSTYASRLVREAKEVVAQKGNTWMPAHVLLGLAVTESDLRWWLKRGYSTVADCGLTQINLTSLRMTTWKKRKLCKALRSKRTTNPTATKLSMQWTMKEMRRIKARYCNATWLARIKRYHKYSALRKLTDREHFFRCVLTVYNQGPRFVTYTWNTCTFKVGREHYTAARAKVMRRKCQDRARYWLRTWCFAEGVRLGKAPMYKRRGRLRRASCRRVWTLAQVRKLYAYKPPATSRLTQPSTSAKVQPSTLAQRLQGEGNQDDQHRRRHP